MNELCLRFELKTYTKMMSLHFQQKIPLCKQEYFLAVIWKSCENIS